MLDSRFEIATPEGVDLSLAVAGLGPRAMAWLIDTLIRLAFLMVSSSLLVVLGEAGAGLFMIVMFFVWWFYNVGFEVLRNGATPGKRTLGLRVVNANGTPVGWPASIIRNFIRVVDALPGTYLFGFISVVCSRNFQRLGDLAAGTLVIYDNDESRQRPVSAEVGALAVTVSMTPLEQQAVIDYADRTSQITRERADELAAIVEGVIGDGTVSTLRGHANWLAGRRQ